MKKRHISAIVMLLIAITIIIILLITFNSCEEEGTPTPTLEEEIEECSKKTVLFQGWCYADLAEKYADPNLCDLIDAIEEETYDDTQFVSNKGACLADVIPVMNYDYSLCDRVADDSYQHNLCIVFAAMDEAEEKKDPAVCDILDSYSYGGKAECLAQSVDSEDDLSVCDQVSNKDLCIQEAYDELAVFLKDVDYCYKIDNKSNTANCVGNLAETVGDLSLCDTLEFDQYICVCYNTFFDEISANTCKDLSGTQKSNCETCVEMAIFEER